MPYKEKRISAYLGRKNTKHVRIRKKYQTLNAHIKKEK
jgi:hypothetical protein